MQHFNQFQPGYGSFYLFSFKSNPAFEWSSDPQPRERVPVTLTSTERTITVPLDSVRDLSVCGQSSVFLHWPQRSLNGTAENKIASTFHQQWFQHCHILWNRRSLNECDDSVHTGY